jgi:hypothetical protein
MHSLMHTRTRTDAHSRQAGRHGDSSCMYVPYSFSIIFGTRVPDCPLTGPIAVPYLRIFL